MKKWLEKLSRNQYALLLLSIWAAVTGFLLLVGVAQSLAFIGGVVVMYPSHFIFGRIEFGRWWFGL